MPWIALEINDMDKTVEPELYSTTALVFPGTTQLFSKFRAKIPIREKQLIPKLFAYLAWLLHYSQDA
jgi:hypothetical protein